MFATCPSTTHAFDLVLCVSTLEHVGADNSGYGLDAEDDGASRLTALRELRRVLAPSGRLLITVPCGEPGDYGWFHQDDVRGWTRLFARAGFFVEEQEVYELTEEGWRAAPELDTTGLRYGERGPAASAVLCAELSPRRLRRLLSPDGIERTARRRAPRAAPSAAPAPPNGVGLAQGLGPVTDTFVDKGFRSGGKRMRLLLVDDDAGFRAAPEDDVRGRPGRGGRGRKRRRGRVAHLGVAARRDRARRRHARHGRARVLPRAEVQRGHAARSASSC